MTDPLFFDTDGLSAFLWVKNESLLVKLYPGRIVIPQAVYGELSYPGTSYLKARADAMLAAGQAILMEMEAGTHEYDLYFKLTQAPDAGHRIIGDGEAAAIALAKERGGIVVSNNLSDVTDYIKEYGLPLLKTGDIFVEALRQGLLTEAEGNNLWAYMHKRRRKLGAKTFSEYLKQNS